MALPMLDRLDIEWNGVPCSSTIFVAFTVAGLTSKRRTGFPLQSGNSAALLPESCERCDDNRAPDRFGSQVFEPERGRPEGFS